MLFIWLCVRLCGCLLACVFVLFMYVFVGMVVCVVGWLLLGAHAFVRACLVWVCVGR